GRLFIVKRAKTDVVSPTFLKFNIPGNELSNVGPLFYMFNCLLWDIHTLSSFNIYFTIYILHYFICFFFNGFFIYINNRTTYFFYNRIKVFQFFLNPFIFGIAGCIFKTQLSQSLFSDFIQRGGFYSQPYTFGGRYFKQFFWRGHLRNK